MSLNQIFRKTTAVLALGLSLCATSSMAEEKNLPLSGETLAVAFSIAPPFVLVRGEFSDLAGIDVDLVRELQRRTGFKTHNNRYDIMNFGDLMTMGREGRLDIMGGGIYQNPERAKVYDFAGPSFHTEVALVTHRDSTIKDVTDLNGKRLAAEFGTVASDLVPPESGVKARMMNTPTNFMAMYNVSRGYADAVITDVPLAQEYIVNWPDCNLEIRKIMPDTEADMAIILKKGTEVTRVLQEVYKEMLADGTVERIVKSYLKDANTAALTRSDLDASNKVEAVVEKVASEGVDQHIDEVKEVLPKDSRLVVVKNEQSKPVQAAHPAQPAQPEQQPAPANDLRPTQLPANIDTVNQDAA